MFKIAEAAKFLGVSKDTLRRWEKAGKIHSVRTPSGYRVYSQDELERVKTGQTLSNPMQNPTYLISDATQAIDQLGLEKSIKDQNLERKRLAGQIHTGFPSEEKIAALVNLPDDVQLFQNSKRSFVSYKSGLSILIVVILLAGISFPARFLYQSRSNSSSKQLAAGFSSQSGLGQVLAASSPSETQLQINTDTEVNGQLTVNGDEVLTGTLTAPNISGNTQVSGNTTLTGDLIVSGNTTLSSLNTGIVHATNGALTVSGIDLTQDVTNTLGVANGGTGSSKAPTNGQLLIGNGTNYTLGNITAGSGITVTNGTGTITISSTSTSTAGVTSITGTTGEIVTSGSTGDVTLSLPQAIDTTSSPTFANVNATSALKLNGADINTAGTLSNVAYIDQTNTFTDAQIISRAGNPATPQSGEIFYDSTAGKFKIVEGGTVKVVCNTTDLGCGAGGGGGVVTLDGLSGALTLANSTGSSTTITIDNAAADGSTKGISTFNATNFTASSGLINTIQDIATNSTPTFSKLNLSGTSNQIVFQSAGVTGTLSWTPTSLNKLLTLPDATDTLVGRATTDTLTNKTIDATSNTISNLTNANLSGSAGITNANLANSAITINTTSPVGGGGSVSLGGTITLTCATCLVTGGNLFTAAGTSGSSSTIAQGGTLTVAAGTDITTTGNGSGTITIANSSTLSSVTGRGNATSTGIQLTEKGNTSTDYALYLKRNTDTSPAGYLIQAQNAAANSNLFAVDVNGDITAGIWNGSVIGTQYGGTGVSSFTSNGILYGNGSGTVQVTAAGGAGTTCLTESAGGIPSFTACPGASGVGSITGTANQVLANGTSGSAQTGAITLTLP